jgi:hypothetical protein
MALIASGASILLASRQSVRLYVSLNFLVSIDVLMDVAIENMNSRLSLPPNP